MQRNISALVSSRLGAWGLGILYKEVNISEDPKSLKTSLNCLISSGNRRPILEEVGLWGGMVREGQRCVNVERGIFLRVALSAKTSFKASAPNRETQPGTLVHGASPMVLGVCNSADWGPSPTWPNSQASQRSGSLPGFTEPHTHHSYSSMHGT